MIRLIKRIIVNLLSKRGNIVRKSISNNQVVDLIESLHPYKTQYELIRMGGDNDGGYLVPNHLEGIEACFSPGVGDSSSFEIDCLQRGIKVYIADKSVTKPNLHGEKYDYDFTKKFIGCTNNSDYMTMDQWVASSGISDHADMMLQMDIETSEYLALANASDALIKRFRIMLIEFHVLTDLWIPSFFGLAEAIFKKILQSHICVHIHPNNHGGIHHHKGVAIPYTAEFSFIRRDCVEIKGYASKFPHQLDIINDPTNNDIPLPKNWYRST